MLEQKILDELKTKLLEEKRGLEEELNKIAKKENGDYEAKFEDFGRDEEDNAEEVENYANKVGITENLEKKLEDVNLALEKMKKGRYGFCENCQKDIPLERLRAYPAAKDCIDCK